MARLYSFPPVSTADAHTLILGSMPGQASLAAGEYYAHPRNLFLPILGELFGASPALPYAERLKKLSAAGLALWDVLWCCEREGSLDGSIAPASIVANDFAGFLAGHPHIVRVFFNGTLAEASFRRHVLRTLPPRPLHLTRLPSTSPANAAFSFARRLEAWRALTLATVDAGPALPPISAQRSST